MNLALPLSLVFLVKYFIIEYKEETKNAFVEREFNLLLRKTSL
jgi:hypothetical protein